MEESLLPLSRRSRNVGEGISPFDKLLNEFGRELGGDDGSVAAGVKARNVLKTGRCTGIETIGRFVVFVAITLDFGSFWFCEGAEFTGI